MGLFRTSSGWGKNGDNLREALLAMSVAGSLPPQYNNTIQVLVNPLLPGVKGRGTGNPSPLEPSPSVGASGIQTAGELLLECCRLVAETMCDPDSLSRLGGESCSEEGK